MEAMAHQRAPVETSDVLRITLAFLLKIEKCACTDEREPVIGRSDPLGGRVRLVTSDKA